MKKPCIIFLLALLLSHGKSMAGAVGEWTVYPAMGEIADAVQAGNMLYVLAGTSLYSVNTADQSVIVYDKIRYLSDTQISFIAWCEAAEKLVIVYSNQDIDLLKNDGSVENIPDFYSKTMTEDKTVNSVDIEGADAFLSTAFGIVRVNVAKAEITDTYNLGFSVTWTHTDNERIYAESSRQGQYSALLSDNLLDPASWEYTAPYTAKKTSSDSGLLSLAEQYMPNAPASNYFGYMKLFGSDLYTVSGAFSGERERSAAVQILSGGTWTVIEGDTGFDAEPLYRGLFAIDRDPADPGRWLVGALPGLYEYTGGEITQCWYWKNSLLERAVTVDDTNANYTEVTSLCFDPQGNAWMTQGIAATGGIIKLSPDGQFTRYEHPEMMLSAGYSWVKPMGLAFSSSGLLWFVNNDYRTPALASYDTGNDILTTYTSFINEDSSEINLTYTRCWAEDAEGNIWLGTDVGPAYIAKADLESGGTTFYQPKIPREDDETLADYLLSGVDISCMAVDAGNRKWFGTNGNGVYLISADNMTQISRFTSENSGLLSDNVEAIVIDSSSGEVYISTDKGLCSYSSAVTQTAENLENGNIYAYPNPVRPDYTGLITVAGLTYGAQVRITTASGQLVKEGPSVGGSFFWDCTDTKGRKVASGVYIVLVSTSDGKNGAACKIAVVR